MRLFAMPSHVAGQGRAAATAFGVIMTGRNVGVLFGPILKLLIGVGYIIGVLVTGIIMFAAVNTRREEFGVLKAEVDRISASSDSGRG